MHLKTRVCSFAKRAGEKIKRLKKLKKLRPHRSTKDKQSANDSIVPIAPAVEPESVPTPSSSQIAVSAERSHYQHDGSEKAITGCAIQIVLQRLKGTSVVDLAQGMCTDGRVYASVITVAATLIYGDIPQGVAATNVIRAAMTLVSYTHKSKVPAAFAPTLLERMEEDDRMAIVATSGTPIEPKRIAPADAGPTDIERLAELPYFREPELPTANTIEMELREAMATELQRPASVDSDMTLAVVTAAANNTDHSHLKDDGVGFWKICESILDVLLTPVTVDLHSFTARGVNHCLDE
ncbi:hypothetical protein EC988_001475 [Linderina pennispora]|nr:hypothetical protein EC988_001475 [Linderina pennispora]